MFKESFGPIQAPESKDKILPKKVRKEKDEVSSEEKLQKIYMVKVPMDSHYTDTKKPIVALKKEEKEEKEEDLNFAALVETVIIRAGNEEEARKKAFQYDFGNKKPAEGEGPEEVKELTSEELDKYATDILADVYDKKRKRLSKEEARIIAADWKSLAGDKREKILLDFGMDMRIPLKLANIEAEKGAMNTDKQEKHEPREKYPEEPLAEKIVERK